MLAGTALVVYVADQVSKAVVVTASTGESFNVLGDFVRIWYVQNTAAKFSLFSGAIWLFVPVTVLALVMIGYFYLSRSGTGGRGSTSCSARSWAGRSATSRTECVSGTSSTSSASASVTGGSPRSTSPTRPSW